MSKKFIDKFSINKDNHLEFSQFVEKLSSDNNTGVIETLIDIVEEYDIEMTQIKNLLSESLIQKIKLESGMLNDDSVPMF